jgi:hypothetical protein|tara:strand:- start:35 stop:151 length:117 start_codon:yes stop_codon:yes gene_type:complete
MAMRPERLAAALNTIDRSDADPVAGGGYIEKTPLGSVE